MPEPVVIIGPARGPAGPIGEPSEALDRVAADDTGDSPEHERNKGTVKKSMLLSALARLGSGVVMLLARVLRISAKLAMSLINHYPRHSLAAGASLVILGAISYSQNFSGTRARSHVPNQIKGASATGSPVAPKNTEITKNDGASASPIKSESNKSGDSEVAQTDGKAPASPVAGGPEDKSAPAPTLAAKDDASVAHSPKTAGPAAGQDSGPAPEKAAPAADVTAANDAPAPPPASPVDQTSPTLLGSGPLDPAPSPAAPVVTAEKGDGDAVKPAPPMEAPALIADLASSSGPPAEVAPAPTPAGDPVQLATTGDDQNKSAPASTPPPQSTAGAATQPPSTTGEAANANANANVKSNEALAQTEPKTVVKPQDAPRSDPVPQANPAKSQPESTPADQVKAESPKAENARVEAAAPAVLGAADGPKVAPASPATGEGPVPGREVTGAAKPSVESSAAALESPAANARDTASQPAIPPFTPVAAALPLDSPLPVADSRSQVVEPQPRVSATKTANNGSPKATLDATQQPDPSRGAIEKQSDLEAKPRANQDLASAGWVTVPNSGKNLFEDVTNADAQREGSSSGMGAEAAATRDVRAHAAKDVSFELESPRARVNADLEPNGPHSAVRSGAGREPSSRTPAARVEPNAHVVEPEENFWTISRLYYSSGRYYRALWKANADKYPEIDKLTVNDVIVVPAVEDLDPAFIDPPRVRSPAALGTARKSGGRSGGSTRDTADGLAESSVSSSAAPRGERISTARTNRDSGESIPISRSSRTDSDLDLPAPDAVSRRSNSPDRTGRRVGRALDDSDALAEPETRTAARPRATAAASKRRPVYKIRQYDTLRSIARDMLGDSHRSTEILDLNRDLIDDPAHLIVGQVIELPDDARTSVRRSARR